MRELVCAAAARAGIPVQVRGVEVGELPRLREAFVTNVRWGVQPIAQLEGRALDARSHARELRRLIDAAQP
jgi:branched-subunit amino acid aminotransferase/4-amino-4-deoxychorismate lyase